MLIIAYLQMEVKENDHLPLTRLEECIFYIVVEDVHFVPTHAGVSEGQRCVSVNILYPVVSLVNCYQVQQPSREMVCWSITLDERQACRGLLQDNREFNANLKPLVCASRVPLILFCTMLGRMYKSFSLGLDLLLETMSVSCFTKSSFSFSSASLVLNFFCTSLMSLKAVFRLEDGADSSPGSLVLVLRYVLLQGNKI